MKKYLGLKSNLNVVEEYKGLAIVGGYKNNIYKVACLLIDNNKTYIQTGSGLHSYRSVGQAKEQIDFYFDNLERLKSSKSYNTYKSIHY